VSRDDPAPGEAGSAAAGEAARRLFLAFWPEGEVREALIRVAAEVAGRWGAERVPGADLHLTLQFLGKVAPGQERALRAACARLDFDGCKLELREVAFWPSSRTLCLLAAFAPDSALALVAALAAQSAALGLVPATHAWQPHVTLARVRNRARPQQSGVPMEEAPAPPAAWALAAPVRWRVHGFCLAESQPGGDPALPRYGILERWVARGAARGAN